MRKRLAPIFIASAVLAGALSLTGCGSNDQAVEDAAKKSEAASGAIILDKPASGPGKAMMKPKAPAADQPK